MTPALDPAEGVTAPAALVTGARRGIGRATALALGEAGMRVAVTCRTAGGLSDTVAEIEAAGGSALAVELDLSDRCSIARALDRVFDTWGGLDVLVNNALCDQPGSQDLIAGMDVSAFETMIIGEVVNTSYLTRQALDRRAASPPAGPLTVINVGSAAAEHVPPQPYGRGGWAFSYSASKAALHRLAPFLQLEYAERVRAFTVDPGFVRTEALLERLGDIPHGAPPSLPAAVIRWLAVDPSADAHRGGYLHAQQVASDLGLAG